MSKIPCSGCITLAACLNRDKIYCKMLYGFMCHYDSGGFTAYRAGRSDVVRSFFDKYVVSTQYYGWEISLDEREDVKRVDIGSMGGGLY